MIKFLVKTVIVVLLLLLLIPLFKLLMQLITHVFVELGICIGGEIDLWALGSFAFIGLFIFFVVLIFKD